MEISIISDVVVTPYLDEEGYESERRGAEYFYLTAWDEGGNRWVSPSTYPTEAGAFAALAVTNDPDDNPNAWRPIAPAYGSAAWTQDDEAALASFEAHAYNEPVPEWVML